MTEQTPLILNWQKIPCTNTALYCFKAIIYINHSKIVLRLYKYWHRDYQLIISYQAKHYRTKRFYATNDEKAKVRSQNILQGKVSMLIKLPRSILEHFKENNNDL